MLSPPKQRHRKEPSKWETLPEPHRPRPADARSPEPRLGRLAEGVPPAAPGAYAGLAAGPAANSLPGHCLLLQRLQENSDLKTHQPFAAVMTTLCECKDQASKTFIR